MNKVINVLQVGLGPIGLGISKVLSSKKWVQIVGAIDIDPEKQGQDLGRLIGQKDWGVKITKDLNLTLKNKSIDIAIFTTSSKAKVLETQIELLLKAKIPVVTTCEELSFPWMTVEKVARRIDTLAIENGVSVLSTGVNPGFLMDFLPSVSTCICHSISQIKVERIQDASMRRQPFRQKIGVGLSKEEFEGRVKKKLIRHVGLRESVYFLAHQFGWVLDEVVETLLPVLDDDNRAKGLNQRAVGYVGKKEKIILEFVAFEGAKEPKDIISIQGEPNLEVSIGPQVNGDMATTAIIVHAIPSVLQARPGLRTMGDIGPITYRE